MPSDVCAAPGVADPLAGSRWSDPATIAGFAQGSPNSRLIAFAARARALGKTRAIDIGCGAGRNTLPLAAQGWTILGTDLSWPMVRAAQARPPAGTQGWAVAPMERLPVRSASVDLIVAHGIWNLARTTAQFRAAVQEASRIARLGAGLFVFTFSRRTLPPASEMVAGEQFVFTQFSGEPQCFLTEAQLLAELGAVGFDPDPAFPLMEHNVPPPGALRPSAPVIFEGGFVRRQ